MPSANTSRAGGGQSKGGSNYNFSKTKSGQGNFNSGGARTGTGSFDKGIRPVAQPVRKVVKNFAQKAAPVAVRPRPPVIPQIPQELVAAWGEDDRAPRPSWASVQSPTMRDDRMPSAPPRMNPGIYGPRSDRSLSLVRSGGQMDDPKYGFPSGNWDYSGMARKDQSRVPQSASMGIMSQLGRGYGIDPLGDPNRFQYDKKRGRGGTLTGVKPEVLSKMLDAQRRFGAPVRPTSGMRNPLLNRLVGGVKGSQHMQGKAIDLGIDDRQGDETARLIEAMKQAGFTGMGGYRPGKVHGDIGPARQWGPDTHAGSISQLPQSMQITMAGGPAPPRSGILQSLFGSARP